MNKSEITTAGFAPATRCPRRLIASIQGPVKAGKTRLALTAKKPLGYISLEIGGDEGVVDQFIKAGVNSTDEIQVAKIHMPNIPHPDSAGMSEDAYQKAITQGIQDAAAETMDKFYAAYYTSLENFATTVVDTGSDLWEIHRLANFGRLEKIPQLAYGQLNKVMDKIIEDAFSYKGNVIFIHHMKEKWETFVNEKGKEQGRPSGTFDMAGYKDMKKKVQAVIELWRDDLSEPDEVTQQLVKFHAEIIDSRHFAGAMGKHFEYDFTFADIGMAIIPGTTKKDWE